MVHRMRRPEPAHAVTGAVEPVVTKILANHEHHDRDGEIQRHREQAMLPGEANGRRSEARGQEDHDDILTAERIGERGEIGAPVVVPPHDQGEDQAFQRREYDRARQGELKDGDELRHGRSPVRRMR